MKKIILLSLLVLGLSSCKKTYTCVCNVSIIDNSDGTTAFTSSSSSHYSAKMTSAQAKSACSSSAEQVRANEDAAFAPDYHTNASCNVAL